ncbi:MAG: CvpA family protein [Chloroflexota bacterium]|nr:CvpA family protein [Chloroflexota bacterium]
MINTYVDILLILIILYNVIRGWQSGFLISMLDLLSWLGSLIVAFRFYDEVAQWIGPLISLPAALIRPIAFAGTAIFSGLLLVLLSRVVLEEIPRRVHVNGFNRLLGVLPGLISGLIAVAIVASLLLSLPLPGSLLVATRNSALSDRFASLTDRLESELTPIFGDAISHTLNLLTIHPESDELVQLPYTVSDAVLAPELEQQMLVMINQERVKVGLHPLEMDPQLTEVARRHSQDMFARGYFSHITPEGMTPFDRIHAGGVTYRIAGENLAHAATLMIAHRGLMNSPGHRANILHPEYGRVGIGILDGRARGLMITQNFRE